MEKLSLNLEKFITNVKQRGKKVWFVSDLDGTLLGNNSEAVPGDLEKIAQLLNNGLLFTVASARSLQAITQVLGKLPFPLPVVQKNGSSVSNYTTGERLMLSPIAPSVYKKVFPFIRANKISMVVATGLLSCNDEGLLRIPQELVGDPAADVRLLKGDEFTTLELPAGIRTENFLRSAIANKDKRLRICSDMALLSHHHVLGLTLFHRPEVLKQFVADIGKDANLEQSLNIYFMYVRDDGFQRMTIQAKSASKFDALKVICQHSNLEIENCVAFGDNSNDVEMLQKVGYGIAVANGKKEAHDCAKEIIGENYKGSVVKTLQCCLPAILS